MGTIYALKLFRNPSKKKKSQIFFSVLKNWMIVSILCIIEGKAENDAWVLFQKERERERK